MNMLRNKYNLRMKKTRITEMKNLILMIKKILDYDNEDDRKEDHGDDHNEDEEFQNENLDDDNIENSFKTAIVIENRMYVILRGNFRSVVGVLEDSKIRFRELTKKPFPLPGPPGTIISRSTSRIESHKEFSLVRKIYSNSFLSC